MRPKVLTAIALALLLCLGLIVYAKTSRGGRGAYSLAEDFPRGALVYAQFRDLPALVKQWDESSLKQQYLNSANYHQLQHRHLALKLAARLEEFSDALGFPLDTSIITDTADASAACAVYDIGRLDIVFIAPLGEERAAATMFFQNSGQFEETELPDGTTYYRHEVEADRGRQKQEIVFATLKGRFVLATNEQLFLRSLSNINGRTRRDRLSDDSSFKTLSAELPPHFATVWVDQAKLNEDWYFKHYWLMQNVEQFRGIRASMFDLEIEDGKWIERRDFLTVGRDVNKRSAIESDDAQRMQAMIPDGVPFFRLQSVGHDTAQAASLIRDTLLDRLPTTEDRDNNDWDWQSYDGGYFNSSYEDEDATSERYSSLDEDYDSMIDDPHDARVSRREEPGANPLAVEMETQFASRLQQVIEVAHPMAMATATSPQTSAAPLFVEFRRVAILTLQNPAGLNLEALENAVSDAAQSRLTVAGKSVDLKWVSHNEVGQSWRSLDLPVLGWQLCYALRDHELIVANSSELLAATLANHNAPVPSHAHSLSQTNDLTVIRLDQRKQAFDEVLGRLDTEAAERQARAHNAHENSVSTSDEFFSGNISSLLDVASSVSRIEIRRSSATNRLHEEIVFILK
ncbi:MAG: hypothetical protein AUG51_03155 [Acidobacteria bacterium 13_1_20CM_3_53_8]|nr:MAG: hypothetical protein AUG51_03155 [Acidobacteria bacterium 13_1_20CM_3_53_8]